MYVKDMIREQTKALPNMIRIFFKVKSEVSTEKSGVFIKISYDLIFKFFEFEVKR